MPKVRVGYIKDLKGARKELLLALGTGTRKLFWSILLYTEPHHLTLFDTKSSVTAVINLTMWCLCPEYFVKEFETLGSQSYLVLRAELNGLVLCKLKLSSDESEDSGGSAST